MEIWPCELETGAIQTRSIFRRLIKAICFQNSNRPHSPTPVKGFDRSSFGWECWKKEHIPWQTHTKYCGYMLSCTKSWVVVTGKNSTTISGGLMSLKTNEAISHRHKNDTTHSNKWPCIHKPDFLDEENFELFRDSLKGSNGEMTIDFELKTCTFSIRI